MVTYTSDFPDRVLPKTNLYSFIASNPNKTSDSSTLLIDDVTKRTITFGEWKRDARRWATGLQSIGFKRGDVLAIYSSNQVDYSIAMFGPLILGAITTTVNSFYTVDELAFQLTDSGATAIVTQPESLATTIEAAKAVGISKDRIFLFGGKAIEGFQPYSSIFPPIDTPTSSLAPILSLDGDAAVDSTALICYSSGTTGRSKGVELTHYNLSSNLLQMNAYEHDIHPHDDRTLNVLPMYHIYGIMSHLLDGIYNGIFNIIMPRFNPEGFLQAIQEYKVKSLNLVPPQALVFIKSPLVPKYDLSSLRHISVGAAPCSKEFVESLLQRLPQIRFRQLYGMTELSPMVAQGYFHNCVLGSVGRSVSNQEIRIIDPETGKDVAAGTPGELIARGPNVMKGYRNNPQATKTSIDADGWFHTGDTAKVDKDGNIFVVDRLKELIKYKGFQVPPAELEDILLTHPHVADAAVIGVELKAEATEVPIAYVVRHEGKELSDKEVSDFVAARVAPYKKLRGGVRFVELIPKSPSGKILRKELRERLKQEMHDRSVTAKL
ncbi:hypothetical protein BGW38_009727 [Lunasporangiospora selenospora]|uniref:Acyl-CoA synthetase (AMP-forming)/AMP-acid ligase II n=1 Tax=Lunasporangiospora selenospora TaxID=979761 RepID=A0A9P6FYA3_9FUNG|nr:hypothetical protein BGW38_009727 [Lunasporangiospora selenospora]